MAKDLGSNGLLYLLQSLLGNSTPSMDGTAATGSSPRWARQDHVHPSDTTKADKSAAVTAVTWDSTNKKFTKTINGSSSDIVSAADLRTGLNVEDGAEANVQPDWSESDNTKDAFIKNKPTLGAAAEKDVDTTVTSGSSKLPTSGAVASAIASAVTGAAVYKGTVNAGTDISGLSDYKKGWYWFVATAGTYVGQTCEVGDMIIAHADMNSSYSASDFDVLQTNIVELTNAEIDAIISNANS